MHSIKRSMTCVLIVLGAHVGSFICNEPREVIISINGKVVGQRGFLNDSDIMADGWRHESFCKLFLVLQCQNGNLHINMTMNT